jgi:hypothetical protein
MSEGGHIVDMHNKSTTRKGIRKFKSSIKGTCKIMATLVVVMVTFVSGFIFLRFVVSNVDFAKTTFTNQMQNLLLKSFSINSTHIVALIQNEYSKAISFTLAYVNGLIATLKGGETVISALSTGTAAIVGSFTEGNTYTVTLTNIFSIDLTFTVTA